MSLAVFFHGMVNWLENTNIFPVMKYTIKWESYKKKLPVLWQNYEYQIPGFSPFDGFCCVFLYYGQLMGKSKYANRSTESWRTQLHYFPKWLCLVHGKLAVPLRHLERCIICKCQCFCLFDIQHNGQFYLKYYFLRHRNPPWRDSARYQLLRLYSQFPFIKVLKALQVLMVTAFWRNVSRQTSVTKTSTRCHFRAYLLKFISISLFCKYFLKADI